MQATRELTQREGLACPGQCVDRLVLGGRQPDFSQDLLEARLDALRSFEQHDHVTSMILAFGLRSGTGAG